MTGGTVRYSWHSTLTWLRNVAPLACEEQFLSEPASVCIFIFFKGGGALCRTKTH